MIAFRKYIVIHWADQTSRVTPDQLARDVGIPVAEVGNALDQLEARGLLVRRADGDYDAAVPEGVEHE